MSKRKYKSLDESSGSVKLPTNTVGNKFLDQVKVDKQKQVAAKKSPWNSYPLYKQIYKYVLYTSKYNLKFTISMLRWIIIRCPPIPYENSKSFSRTVQRTYLLYKGLRDVHCGRYYSFYDEFNKLNERQ